MDEQNFNNSNGTQNMQYTQNVQNTPNMNYAPNMNNTQNFSNDYKPISAWGYVGYQLLFAIPIVGFICIIVFSLGGSTNQNVKNFARSYLCMWLIAIIVAIIVGIITAVLGVGIFGTASNLSSYYY